MVPHLPGFLNKTAKSNYTSQKIYKCEFWKFWGLLRVGMISGVYKAAPGSLAPPANASLTPQGIKQVGEHKRRGDKRRTDPTKLQTTKEFEIRLVRSAILTFAWERQKTQHHVSSAYIIPYNPSLLGVQWLLQLAAT